MKSLLHHMWKKIVFVVLLVVVGCDLNVTDPNTATEQEVLSSREGIISFTIGMQGYYSSTTLPALIRTTAVTTRELAINTTFANLIDLENGGTNLPESNGNVLQVWSRALRVVEMADKIIQNAPNVPLSDAERSEILAIAHIYKAMSLGFLVQDFEQSPIQTNPTGNVEFQSRDQVLAESISLLNTALDQMSQTPPASSTTVAGFDLQNTAYALLARYNLLAGNYQAAIDASNQVDPAATSVFSFDGTTSRNPVFDDVYTAEDYIARDNFGTPLTEAGDGRLGFYLVSVDTTSQPNGLQSDLLAGFFDAADKDIPVYLPGEMNLIRAEAYVRLSQPGQAVNEIDAIRTKQAANDPFGVGANLPAYNGPTDDQSLLTEIYRQRSAEMYLTGMRFEDARRLGRPVPGDNPPLTAERNRVYYPYPTQERQSNPNTPANPAI